MSGPTDAFITALAAQLIEPLAERLAQHLALDMERNARTELTESKPDFLSEAALAKRSGISCRTLQGWRARGGGPRWVKVGRRVLYPRLDADAFLARGPKSKAAE